MRLGTGTTCNCKGVKFEGGETGQLLQQLSKKGGFGTRHCTESVFPKSEGKLTGTDVVDDGGGRIAFPAGGREK